MGEFRITNEEYETAYANKESDEFKAKALEMENKVCVRIIAIKTDVLGIYQSS